MKVIFASVLAAVALAGRKERQERRQERWNAIEDLINNSIERIEDANEYLQEEIVPEIKNYRKHSDDLHATIEDQMDWDTIEDMNTFGDRVDDLDWDLVMDKIKAFDTNERINWDHVDMRIDQARERRERANAKMEEMNNKINEKIDWDKINEHVDRTNAKINAISWSDIQDQFETSAETIKNAKWDNVIRKDEKRINWDFLSSQMDMFIDEFNDSIDVLSEQLDNMKEVDTEEVEVVVPETIVEKVEEPVFVEESVEEFFMPEPLHFQDEQN